MEFQKNFGNFTIAGGSVTAAGKGNISEPVPAPKNVRTKHNKKEIAVSAVKAAALTGLVLLKIKSGKKK